MNEETITRLHGQWQKSVDDGMGNCLIGEAEFLELTKETFWLLSSLKSNRSIPNSVTRILILMQEFAVYCWFSDKAHSMDMWEIVSNMLSDFLDGFEQCGSVYPMLKLDDWYTIGFFDFNTNTLSDMKITDEMPF